MSRAHDWEVTQTQSREKRRAGIIAAGCRHDGELKQRVDISWAGEERREHTWSDHRDIIAIFPPSLPPDSPTAPGPA